MSYKMEEYDYKVNTLECICNVCSNIKLCLQCNECFVTTCVKCISLIKCNNCNNLFTKYELELIGYKNYNKNINKLEYELYEHKKLYDIDLSKYTKIIDNRISELNDEITFKIRVSVKFIYDELRLTKNKKLVKLFYEICQLSFINKNFTQIDYINCKGIMDDVVNEINKLICKRRIYRECLIYYTNTIYIQYDMEKLENSIDNYMTENDYTKKYISINESYIKYIINKGRICMNNCLKSVEPGHKCEDKVCKYYLKYYEDIKNKSKCPNCDHYNFIFKNYQQIYCYTCHILYDNISYKQEIFIINPFSIYHGISFYKDIQNCKFNKYINILPEEIQINLKNKKYVKKLNSNLNLCKIFGKQLGK